MSGRRHTSPVSVHAKTAAKPRGVTGARALPPAGGGPAHSGAPVTRPGGKARAHPLALTPGHARGRAQSSQVGAHRSNVTGGRGAGLAPALAVLVWAAGAAGVAGPPLPERVLSGHRSLLQLSAHWGSLLSSPCVLVGLGFSAQSALRDTSSRLPFCHRCGRYAI